MMISLFIWFHWFLMCWSHPLFINPLNAKLNPICHLVVLLGAHHILHVSRVRVNKVTNVQWNKFWNYNENWQVILLTVQHNKFKYILILHTEHSCMENSKWQKYMDTTGSANGQRQTATLNREISTVRETKTRTSPQKTSGPLMGWEQVTGHKTLQAIWWRRWWWWW